MEIFLFFLIVAIVIVMVPIYIKFERSDYKNQSGNSFLKTVLNKGNYGEFLTFSFLEKISGHKKLMTNLYLPKEDGSTTEIDLIMLFQTGIYVFESKNYSGWIFGDEKSKNWMQTLQNKQKNSFFNPIWQNKAHINTLKSVTGLDNDALYNSYIIFSERCTLKKISVTSPNVKVIKRNTLVRTIKKDIENSPKLMKVEEIDNLYSMLQKYTCVNEAVKKAHVDNIRMKM